MNTANDAIKEIEHERENIFKLRNTARGLQREQSYTPAPNNRKAKQNTWNHNFQTLENRQHRTVSPWEKKRENKHRGEPSLLTEEIPGPRARRKNPNGLAASSG